MTTHIKTSWCNHVTSLQTSVSTMCCPIEIMFIFKAIKSILVGHMINRILYSWSYHIKFMKRARFINFIRNDQSCKILYTCIWNPNIVIKGLHFIITVYKQTILITLYHIVKSRQGLWLMSYRDSGMEQKVGRRSRVQIWAMCPLENSINPAVNG